jgi:aspartyl-tRNA synthetase
MEMAFTNANGVMSRMESFIVDMWQLRQKLWAESGVEIPSIPFMRMTYNNAMRYHGVDKPDLRIKDLVGLSGCEITSADYPRSTELKV